MWLTILRILGMKVPLGVVVGALLFAGVLGAKVAITERKLSNAKEVIQGLVEWQDGIISATRLAAGSDKVVAETTAEHIQQLGVIRIELLSAVDKQNTAIEALAAESERAARMARQALKEREAAIKRGEKLAAELRDRAGTPSKDMEGAVRQTQDQLYEAGM